MRDEDVFEAWLHDERKCRRVTGRDLAFELYENDVEVCYSYYMFMLWVK